MSDQVNFITTTIVMQSTNQYTTIKLSTKLKVEKSDITFNEFSVLTSIKTYINNSEDDSFDLKSLEKTNRDNKSAS